MYTIDQFDSVDNAENNVVHQTPVCHAETGFHTEDN